ncbi:hypothetical protein SAMN04489867_0420 [Pedococcus dokdonensis]|uniref:Uncharacterized protein n=1 Tax=Pedococcus dokdonensis TaxID=443156 RepID=A0A1H0LWP1_9MICO|nr:hypothetical protein SAMN04489867_0420 [Pedococcus dokdonensis]
MSPVEAAAALGPLTDEQCEEVARWLRLMASGKDEGGGQP